MLSSGQSYKDSTIVNYDPRVVIYERKMFIILATGPVTKMKHLDMAKKKLEDLHLVYVAE